MPISSLEERVALLEGKIEALLIDRQLTDTRPAWERALDRCIDSEVMRAIDRAALAYRDEDRQKFKEQYDADAGNVE